MMVALEISPGLARPWLECGPVGIMTGAGPFTFVISLRSAIQVAYFWMKLAGRLADRFADEGTRERVHAMIERDEVYDFGDVQRSLDMLFGKEK